jgi:methylase of polypeptide subunit release factors
VRPGVLALEELELALQQIIDGHSASQSAFPPFRHHDPSLATSTDLIPDVAAANALGTSLRRAGYSENAVYELLGEDAYSTEAGEVSTEERRLPATPRANLVRLLFLQLPLARADAQTALRESGLEALEATGLAVVGDEVVPNGRILPVGNLLLASDGFSQDADDPVDYVATYTPTARVLDSLTPRPRVDRALDVGTGSGVHALLAAQHSRQVIATDVNPRALAYTQLNAALNGLRNVECRQGSLFEPVNGETFNLITCNAPYVVSPERRWVYRDSEFQGDEVSERLVAAAADHLADDGYAAMLVSWLGFNGADPDARVVEWAEATGCDSWILPTVNADPLTHAAEWNSHLAGAALGAALDEWTRYFDALDVALISEGAVILHRRGGVQTTRVDELDEEDLEDASDQILRAFEARAWLAEQGDSDDSVLGARISVVSPLRLERELESSAGRAVDVDGTVEIAEGTKHAVDVTADVQEVIASLDSGMTLGDVVETTARRLALEEDETEDLREETLEVVGALLELGALRLHALA